MNKIITAILVILFLASPVIGWLIGKALFFSVML